MDFQPTLQTDRVMVRPLQKDDYTPLFLVAQDKELWAQMPSKGMWKEEKFKIFFNDLLDTKTAFCILDTKNNQPIGTTKYYIHNDLLYMGSTFLSRDYWGGEYNKAFRNLLIEHAFKTFDVIHIHMTVDNKRNQKATRKLGFHYAFIEDIKLGATTRPYMTFRLYKNKKEEENERKRSYRKH